MIKEFAEAIAKAGQKQGNDTEAREYTGRGMFKSEWGVVGDREGHLVSAIAFAVLDLCLNEQQEMAKELADASMCFKTDSMGHGTILY